jgi:peptidase M28-like protein
MTATSPFPISIQMMRSTQRAGLRAALLPCLATLVLAAPHKQVETNTERVSCVEAGTWRDPRAENLERALEAIQVPNVRADIRFIASDELGGRDSPSPGLRIAARFIRARLERLGWTPGAPEGSFFWEYELTQYQLDEAATFARVDWGDGVSPLVFGEDYFLSPNSRHNRDAEGEIVFGGGYDEDEVRGMDFSGKWVLLREGTRLSRKRRGIAEREGILGFLVLADPDAKKTVKEAQGRWTAYMKQPSLNAPRGGGMPVLALSEGASVAFAQGEVELGQPVGATFHEAWTTRKQPLILENVCGLWPGSDPTLRNEVIIVSAHYDHIGTKSSGEINNGADDNGSGTTGLMAIAEALKAYGPMRRTVMLMWVSAEEKGLIGSREWTKNPWLPEGMAPICNINIDMIGRNAPDEIGITPTKDRPEYNRLTQLVEKHMGSEGFTKLNSADAYWGRSDHANFSKNLGIPVAFLFSDVHEDYHKPTDTSDKIDCSKLSRVARLVVRVLHDLQADELEF